MSKKIKSSPHSTAHGTGKHSSNTSPKTGTSTKPATSSSSIAKPVTYTTSYTNTKKLSATTSSHSKPGSIKSSKGSYTSIPTIKITSPPVAPIVFTEMSIKEMPKRMVEDDAGELKAAGKWACVVDAQGLSPRFLRHRDVNMLSVPDAKDMEPETIRKALIGSIKFGKPFILDMMEADMWDFCVDQFDKIQPNLMEALVTRDILDPDTYITLYKDDVDDVLYKNKFDYNVAGFSFMVTTQVSAPSEVMLRKMFPVKIV